MSKVLVIFYSYSAPRAGWRTSLRAARLGDGRSARAAAANRCTRDLALRARLGVPPPTRVSLPGSHPGRIRCGRVDRADLGLPARRSDAQLCPRSAHDASGRGRAVRDGLAWRARRRRGGRRCSAALSRPGRSSTGAAPGACRRSAMPCATRRRPPPRCGLLSGRRRRFDGRIHRDALGL